MVDREEALAMIKRNIDRLAGDPRVRNAGGDRTRFRPGNGVGVARAASRRCGRDQIGWQCTPTAGAGPVATDAAGALLARAR